jgi:hypothetical protein
MSSVLKCIVPLAGPDLIDARYGPRPLFPVNGRPLIATALEGRLWAARLAPSDYVFVLRQIDGLPPIVAFLEETWPGAAIIVLPRLTGGAMLTALCGVALTAVPKMPLVVDLADILFDGGPDLNSWRKGLGGIVPCFHSSDPHYSYLRTEGGKVVEAAEKQVISDNASAGVYFFRDAATYLTAASHSLADPSGQRQLDALFVCPLMNGVLAQGLDVDICDVAAVMPIGKLFH